MMREWINLVEGIGARWGRIYAIARRAEAHLSVAALNAVERWQHANWATGPLAKAYASQSEVMQEITQAFAPVRAAIENEFGPTVRLYRGHEAGEIAGRQLYSWSASPQKAQQFIGSKPTRIWSSADIDAMVAQYERTGFVRAGNRRYVRMKDQPEFYLIYDRHNQVITDGDDLRADLVSTNADRQDYNDRQATKGRLLSADIPVDRIVWMPANALSMEVIVAGDPEQLVEGLLHLQIKDHLISGMSQRELDVWENPNKKQVMRLCQNHFAMHGDANLRGMAHGGKVWVWSAAAATHGQVLPALGFDFAEIETSFKLYKNSDYCMFHVRGYGFQEGDDRPDHNQIVVWSMNSAPILKASPAGRWGCTITDDGYY